MPDTLQLLQLLMARDCAEEALAKPAVRPDDAVLCQCCGESFTLLKRHLQNAHGMDETTYRSTYAIPEDEMLVSVSYAAMKRRCIKAYSGKSLAKT